VGALGTRNGGLLTLILVAVAAVAAGSFLILQFAERPQVADVSPAPGAAVASADQEISFTVDGDARMSDLTVALDGRDVTSKARADGGRVIVPVAGLDDGTHEVALTFSSANLFSRSIERTWSFEVDTVPPRLTVTDPERGALINRQAVRFTGTSEPGVNVEVAAGEKTFTTATGPRGGWTLVAKLDEGIHPVTVSAADEAGNTTRRRQRVGVDVTPPSVQVTAPADDEPLTLTDEPMLYGVVTSENPRLLTYAVTVNGTRTLAASGTSVPLPEGDDEGLAEAGAGEDEPLQFDGRRFALASGGLAQGRNRVVLAVTDAAGNTTTVTHRVMVDTSDTFGGSDMVVGARGGDVTRLQELLLEAGVYPRRAKITGTYDKTTVQSVRRYQRSRGLPVNGQIDARIRTAMMGRIVVNLGQRRLTLIRDRQVVKSYPIAIGTPGYPTPTGEYEIIQKQVDPTWFPPSSPWAAGLGPIPPGPGNPLGTRWIGTSAPAIGIHGTYADYSIGTAASHGCMRMHIPDVEELYDQVAIGMKVVIRP
jgi:lipoprotein-anchoring transpeptidase ErfK/SrfK